MSQDQAGRSARTETFGMRFSPEELRALAGAADEAAESIADYVRKALAMRQQGSPAVPAVNVFVGIASMQVDYHLGTWADARQSTTPEDFPTHLQHLKPDDQEPSK